MQVPRTKVLTRPRRFARNRSLLVLTPVPWRRQVSSSYPERLLSGWSRRRLLSFFLLAFGGILCAYVGGTYVWMYERQEKLLRDWKSQNALNQTLNLTKLSIPRIHLEAVVLEGATWHSLLRGPAHLAGTAPPGTSGNVVIAGHRDTFFRHIHSLKYGDDVYVSNGVRQFHYVVVGRRIVESTELSVLRATKSGELTLITCYPTHAIGPARQRLIVVAKLATGT